MAGQIAPRLLNRRTPTRSYVQKLDTPDECEKLTSALGWMSVRPEGCSMELAVLHSR